LQQVVLNLAGNAIKFTAAGSVTVSLEMIEARPRWITLQISVADTGPGIPPVEQARLFHPFHRAPQATGIEGAGLGLALTASLVRAFGGDIAVESDGHHGSRFVVRLPFQPTVPAASVPAANRDPAGRRVLIVDDSRPIRELYADYLERAGAVCDLAATGTDALARLGAAAYDTVILDLSLPDIDGIQLAQRMRQDHSRAAVRIIGVSAHADPAHRLRALAAGMNAFLVKPVSLIQLSSAISTPAIASGHVLPERLSGLLREEVATLASSIATAVVAGHLETVRVSAHRLRGAATLIPDDALQIAAADLESAAEMANFAEITRHWSSCQQRLSGYLSIA
jgi:CheY-like chemotaxis protein